jgi:hypothetical protein
VTPLHYAFGVDPAPEIADAEGTLRSAQRSFWVILVVFVLSVVLFVGSVLDGTYLAVAISGAFAIALLVVWSRLAFGINRLERSIRDYNQGSK